MIVFSRPCETHLVAVGHAKEQRAALMGTEFGTHCLGRGKRCNFAELLWIAGHVPLNHRPLATSLLQLALAGAVCAAAVAAWRGVYSAATVVLFESQVLVFGKFPKQT